jgi:hypothetical protein
MSQVGNEELREAISASLRAHGLLCRAETKRAAAPYTLRTVLADMEQPLGGLDMTVVVTVHYTIVDRHNAVVFDEKIVTPFTASVGDAFYGVKRLRIASEGAIRSNIAALITRLQALQVTAIAVAGNP